MQRIYYYEAKNAPSELSQRVKSNVIILCFDHFLTSQVKKETAYLAEHRYFKRIIAVARTHNYLSHSPIYLTSVIIFE